MDCVKCSVYINHSPYKIDRIITVINQCTHIYIYIYIYLTLCTYSFEIRGCRGCDRMVVGFIITYEISVCRH